jgi:branched-chain amino acid transport system permease protein
VARLLRILRLAPWLLVLLGLAQLPSLLRPYQVDHGTLVAVYALAAVGLTLLTGYAGQVSLGQGAFVALGAYGYGLLSVKAGLPVGAAMVLALVLTAVTAYVVGWPLLMLRGPYLAMGTLAMAIIVYALLVNLRPLTGGAIGLLRIPPLEVAGYEFRQAELFRAAWGLVLLALLLAGNLVHSRIGLALRALGADEVGAEGLGVPSASYRIHVFALSAALAGMAGVVYALHWRYLSPDTFGAQLSILLVLVVAMGGLHNVTGAVAGTIAVRLLTVWLQDLGTQGACPRGCRWC